MKKRAERLRERVDEVTEYMSEVSSRLIEAEAVLTTIEQREARAATRDAQVVRGGVR
jgi:hypothetical protein